MVLPAGPGAGRAVSTGARLRRAGFLDVARAEHLLADAALGPVLADGDKDSLVDALGAVADPDLALLALVRLADAAEGGAARSVVRILGAEHDARSRLLAVLGASRALGDDLVRRPELLDVVLDPAPGTRVPADRVRAELLEAVGADPDAAVPVATAAGATDALRRAYRRRLLRIAMTDLTADDALELLEDVGAALADLAAAALEGALAIARAEVDDAGRGARLTVLGMGKCGGRELNYVSDVDVIYVVEPGEGTDEAEALQVGARLAAGIGRACSATGAEPPLWPVDAALRPEGKDGPIVRTVASHLAYYERWAKTWEFQALLKARVVAGDRAVGQAYHDVIHPLVWQAVSRENFVVDSQAMRRRVEQNVPAAEADRQLKLGTGGLRDVEFTVQLLQLVHGRTDPEIRSGHTLTALAALADRGYVARDDAARMATAYRFLRVLEHRLQLANLRRTHLLPVAEDDLRRLARAVGMRTEGAEGLLERWRATRRDVRAMHEQLFYRPLLPAVAQLSPGEAALRPGDARARLAAIGYRDPAGAQRHLASLTEGVSRRAAIQRQLLPVMIAWFGEGADPDAGLLAFRTLSEELGTTHWYLKLLRDSGSAAYRLALLLATSRFVTDALRRSPEAVRWLAEDADLAPRPAARLAAEVEAVRARATNAEAAVLTVRAIRRRELARTASAELLQIADPVVAAEAISDVTDVTLDGALAISEAAVRAELELDEAPARMLVVAMGRLGGREAGYGSDADVMFVHEPTEGAEAEAAQRYALAVATRLRASLGAVGAEPPLQVDADLRPEGRAGPLVRSLDSYAEYYARWAAVWESQALLRARPVAGDDDLARRFVALVDPVRYPAGLAQGDVREIRRIKARVESERLPRATDPARHVKLGRGGLADVEWTVQLLQLQHAHEVPELRTTSTLGALDALTSADLVTADDAQVLREAWLLCSGIRNALVLWTGRVGGPAGDVLPASRIDLAGVARILGYPTERTTEFEEDYLRSCRRARQVVERVFYES
ncbi:glutamate-ammonia-ligase adenylyltransferase [Flavimobilis marinus]|uniref:Bifunctional glutamine synthetase adenylyltransferase/adenylyl-removing enzyme n=1 Tax=Flavimobilis marinus TaxID=285351 RepID=A0A1I2FUW9_9MICO|nr:bifunctional [glutamine synthetase] adenylyltransferase/[glutamine synthetase]-adenylyl-L-tyrosine phosphorylase [Flavimobilis marinus]GHG51271.1 glutamate-ammonia-ligase adenylyltransferase [Flavimobilis marinus]SFF08231.1 glutamate-ammonia-ligase adenylyltransferase [Flavimobilis marinus]